MAVLSRLSTALLGVTLLVGPAAAESPAIKAMQEYMADSSGRQWAVCWPVGARRQALRLGFCSRGPYVVLH